MKNLSKWEQDSRQISPTRWNNRKLRKMPKFRLNANNNLNSSDLYHRRLLYKFFALSFDTEPTIQKPGIKDYWSFENYFYGKVDNNFFPVIPNVDKLVQIESNRGNILVFDFVAEAFERFQSFFTMPLKLGRLEQGTPISSPIAHRAFYNSEIEYQNHIKSFVDRYNNFLFLTTNYKKINDPRRYIKEFFKFYFINADSILRSTFYLSSQNPGYGSGLTLEIASLNPADDAAKMEMIESANFNFYTKAAINSGFLIDKNIPWRLNIDLSSPLIVEKYSEVSITGIPFITEIFADYFTRAYVGELQEVINALFYGYRNFYERVPTEGTYASSDGFSPQLATEAPCSDNVLPAPSLEEMQNALPFTYYIEKYVEMKNKETGNHFNKQEVATIARNAIRGTSRGFEVYVASKFRMPWLSPTSAVFQRLKREFEETEEKTLDKFSEHVKMIVMNSISSIY